MLIMAIDDTAPFEDVTGAEDDLTKELIPSNSYLHNASVDQASYNNQNDHVKEENRLDALKCRIVIWPTIIEIYHEFRIVGDPSEDKNELYIPYAGYQVAFLREEYVKFYAESLQKLSERMKTINSHVDTKSPSEESSSHNDITFPEGEGPSQLCTSSSGGSSSHNDITFPEGEGPSQLCTSRTGVDEVSPAKADSDRPEETLSKEMGHKDAPASGDIKSISQNPQSNTKMTKKDVEETGIAPKAGKDMYKFMNSFKRVAENHQQVDNKQMILGLVQVTPFDDDPENLHVLGYKYDKEKNIGLFNHKKINDTVKSHYCKEVANTLCIPVNSSDKTIFANFAPVKPGTDGYCAVVSIHWLLVNFIFQDKSEQILKGIEDLKCHESDALINHIFLVEITKILRSCEVPTLTDLAHIHNIAYEFVRSIDRKLPPRFKRHRQKSWTEDEAKDNEFFKILKECFSGILIPCVDRENRTVTMLKPEHKYVPYNIKAMEPEGNSVGSPERVIIEIYSAESGQVEVGLNPKGVQNNIVKFASRSTENASNVSDSGPGFEKTGNSVGQETIVEIFNKKAGINKANVAVGNPHGNKDTVLPGGTRHSGVSYRMEYSPVDDREHYVTVSLNGLDIPNSPFKIDVGEGELGNASKVKVYGKGLTKGLANKMNDFKVNTKDAGYGRLSLSIEGPSKADIECQENEDGSCKVMYEPTEPGNYIVDVKFADKHVPGSPFSVKIGGEATGRPDIMRPREAVGITHMGSQCELSLDIPGTSLNEIKATVTSPSGVTEVCEIQEVDERHYSIKFVPKEMEVHTVSVKHRDSPYQFSFGLIPEGGTHKVKNIGPGLERGEVDMSLKFNDQHIPDSPATGDARKLTVVSLLDQSLQINKPAAFTVDFHGATGNLDARVLAPSGADYKAIMQDEHKDRYAVRFIPREIGMHCIYVRHNGNHIAGSPFRVMVDKQDADASLVKAYGGGLKRGKTGEQCQFIVNTQNGGSGALAVTVEGSSKVQINCREVDEGYEFTYTTSAPGDYLITIKYAGNTHIAGSPFKATIPASDKCILARWWRAARDFLTKTRGPSRGPSDLQR